MSGYVFLNGEVVHVPFPSLAFTTPPANRSHDAQWALPLCFLLFAKSFEQMMSTR